VGLKNCPSVRMYVRGVRVLISLDLNKIHEVDFVSLYMVSDAELKMHDRDGIISRLEYLFALNLFKKHIQA